MSIKAKISPFKGLKLDMLFFSDFLRYSTNRTTKLFYSTYRTRLNIFF